MSSSKEHYTESLRALDRHLTETQATIRTLIKQHTEPPLSPDMERLKAGLAAAGHKVHSDLYTSNGFTTCLSSGTIDSTALYCEKSNWEMCRVAYDLEKGLFGIPDKYGAHWTTARDLEELGFPPGTPMWFKPRASLGLTRIA